MAVDTAQKRRSMISFGRMNYAERVPEATNFDSAYDRAQAEWLYAGLDISGAGVPTPSSGGTARRRRSYAAIHGHGGSD